MAKTKMICPFSGSLCDECALYRGRHYYLCFCDRYRGHLDETSGGGTVDLPAPGLSLMKKFEIPVINARSAIDPFAIVIKEREKEDKYTEKETPRN
jgi:hypothetical protein